MKKIAFFNNKGGVGKSTAALNVAYSLAKLGKTILVADCDDQRNAYRFLAGVNTGVDDYCGETRYENVDVAYSGEVENFFRKNYDYVILDLPPTLSNSTRELLNLCDFVFVPIELGTFAIQGIANVTEAVATTNARFGGCFINKFDNKNTSDRDLEKLLRNTLGAKVMSAKIPYSKVIKNSISYGQTALEYMPWTASAKAFETLTREIITICEEEADDV